MNTSTVFLPVVPSEDTIRPYAFSVGLFCLAAAAVIIATRGRLLYGQRRTGRDRAAAKLVTAHAKRPPGDSPGGRFGW
jgi:hypothetical protein